MTTGIHGFCEPRFAALREAFAANFENGLELGASLAATWQGRTVVDLWAGWADRERTQPWEENTLTPVASSTKVATTLAVLTLADRGLIELDAPIARYWPEFAQNGKASVTVRDALTHQAGVPGLAEPVAFEQVCDWDYITGRIAAEPHWFGGERRVAYHNSTYGLPLGGLLQRVDGRRPAQFFREEIAAPFGCDFHIALTDRAEMARVAELVQPPPAPPLAPGSLAARILGSVLPGGERHDWRARSSGNPSGGAVGNGRSIARLTSIMAMGGALDGRTWLSPDIVRDAATRQAEGDCPVLGNIAFGLGFGMSSAGFKYATQTMYGWGGFGGSWALMDPAAGFSMGYAPNNWSLYGHRIDPRHDRIRPALAGILESLAA
jgi:CubicO group peptidase (beta-lactamase class C family)